MKHMFKLLLSVCLLLVLTTGCNLFNQSGVDALSLAETPTYKGNANVNFKIVMPAASASTSIKPNIRENNLPTTVLFTMSLVFPGKDATAQNFMIRKSVIVIGGKAEVTFNGVPETPVIAQMQIEHGNYGGKTDFHGALDLHGGDNTIELAPVGSGHAQDISAAVMLDIIRFSEIVKAAPPQLVSSIIMTISPALNSGLTGFSLYQDAINRFVSSSQINIPNLTKLTITNDGGLKTEAGSPAKWSKTPAELWQGIDNSSGLLAKQVIRHGFSAIRAPLVTFSEASGGKFAIAQINSENGAIDKYFFANGTSLSHLSAVVAVDDYLILAAVANGLPVLLRWNTTASVSSGWPVATGVAWGKSFPGITADAGLPYPQVIQLSKIPSDSNKFHAVVRDPATLKLRDYVIDSNGNIEAKQPLPIPGETVSWPLTVFPGNNSTTIHWDDVPNADFYTLYWSLTENVSTTGLSANRIQRITRPFVHSGLESDKTYYYRLTWTIGNSEKGASQEATAKTTAITGENLYRIYYYGNNQSNGLAPQDSGFYKSGDKATILDNLLNLTRTNNIFAGWNTKADGSGTTYQPDSQVTLTNDITLYAFWQQPTATYEITYMGNGNSAGAVPVDTATYESNASVNVLGNSGSLSKTGFIFAGWNTKADGSGTSYNQDDTLTIGNDDKTLYARWIPATPHKVIYNGNGSDGGTVPNTNEYVEETTVTVADNIGNLTNSGAPLTGWNTKADGTGQNYAFSATFIMGKTDITLYAQWREFAGGSGTEADPYQVADGAQLNRIRNHRDKHFKQIADISLDIAPFNSDEGWEPIGTGINSNLFTGKYDGNSKKITGLLINKPSKDFVGLFGDIKNAEIKNLTIENANITGKHATGTLVGRATDSSISNCTSSGNLVGENSSGGLVGQGVSVTLSNCNSSTTVTGKVGAGGFIGDVSSQLTASTLTDCSASGDVVGNYHVGGFAGSTTGTKTIITILQNCIASGDVSGDFHSIGGLAGSHGGYAEINDSRASGKVTALLKSGETVVSVTEVGGLVGFSYGIITKSTASGAVEGGSNVGGLVGRAETGSISKCSSTGSVSSASGKVGGLVGLGYANISDSYATGSVTGNGTVGGLVGRYHQGTINRCYASGLVSFVQGSGSNIGGLFGFADGSVEATYWDIETARKATSTGEGTGVGTGLSTANMKKSASFSGWDFNSIWTIVENTSYPTLR